MNTRNKLNHRVTEHTEKRNPPWSLRLSGEKNMNVIAGPQGPNGYCAHLFTHLFLGCSEEEK